MPDTNRSTVLGVFPTTDQADHAVQDLLKAGFPRQGIGFFLRDSGREGVEMQKDASHYEHEAVTRSVTGTVTGTLLGGALGALTAVLFPGIGTVLGAGLFVASAAATGAIAGGFTGLMSTVGLSEEESRWFQGELEAGRPIVAVEAGNRYSEALAIMETHGGYDMTRRRYTTAPAPAGR